MLERTTIAIDAMGGDHGMRTSLPAVKFMARKRPDVNYILVGKQDKLTLAVKKLKMDGLSNIHIHHASEVVEMDELPSVALRTKKDSSMRVAINLVKEGQAHACVSAGNTGALMATSRFVLKMLPGVDRPAIVFEIPTYDLVTHEVKRVYMLDLGANCECTAEQLYQFGIMGAELAKLGGLKNPRVTLLNIGEEEIKGLDSIKEAAKLLQTDENVNYTGFIEGNQVFYAQADVVVCDGFVGNVALKTAEGTTKMMSGLIKHEIKVSPLLRYLIAPFAYPILARLKKRLDLSQYNGASLLGLRGIVLKSHGSADHRAFATAIKKAILEVDANVPKVIHHRIEAILGNGER